jgi:hypothetical protein
MKAIYLFLFLLFIFAVTFLLADNNTGIDFGLGVVGMTNDQVIQNEENNINFDYKTGYYFGFYVLTPVDELIDLRSELSFCKRGAKFNSISEGFRNHGTYSFDYFNLSATGLYKIKFENTAVKPYVGAGIVGSTPTYAHADSHSQWGSGEGSILSDTNKFAFGCQFLVGLNGALTFMEIRYDQQITPIFKSEDNHMFNDGFWLIVGMKL